MDLDGYDVRFGKQQVVMVEEQLRVSPLICWEIRRIGFGNEMNWRRRKYN
ncbi:hypothetical protein LINPERPRIM_LOCUS27234 [Linum perenne]